MIIATATFGDNGQQLWRTTR